MGELLESVDIISVAKPLAVATAFLGFITGMLYLVGGILYDIFITHTVNRRSAMRFVVLLPIRLLVLIVMPLTFATFGFIVGAIGAFLNNLVVGWLA